MTFAFAPQARKLRETERSATTTSSGIPWLSMSEAANLSSASMSSPKFSTNGTTTSIAATSAPDRSAMISTSPRWSMCWWVSTTSSMSAIDRPRSASWCSSSSSDLPEFGPVSTRVSGSSSIR